MTKEQILIKIETIDTDIKITKELIKFNKKEKKETIFICLIVLIVIFIVPVGTLSTFTVFGISLFTTCSYVMINKLTTQERDSIHKLKKLEIDLNYYNHLLKKYN